MLGAICWSDSAGSYHSVYVCVCVCVFVCTHVMYSWITVNTL